MSNAELMKNLQDFKVGKINILIATNVVEEGLDVSSCN
jgi:ERCC4-related helicase